MSKPQCIIPQYQEDIIQSQDYVKNVFRSPLSRSLNYFKKIFPIVDWLPYYPTQPKWILSDFITGVSVAIVLVPQAMSYAKIAGLAPEYGLYSSFIGLIMYSIFATSKDVSIGPVAVMSLEVSKIIIRVQDKYPGVYTGPEIATTVALLCGGITLGVGLLKLGFLVELIPLPAVMAFTTGSAFSIISGQLPGLMGYSNLVNTHEAAYKVIINFLKNLPNTKVDAAFGLVALFILYVWKYFTQFMANKHKNNYKKKLFWMYMANLRTAIVIIFSTLISFLIIRHHKDNSPFAITGKVASGLQNVGVFTPPANLASRIASELPVATIVLVLEHISIAKSFGRIHDYKIDPNQEFIAIGVTNLIGTFFNAYPATGSFSRTALASKCGVKTPFASIFAGFCVLFAIYCFTSAFYYIPKATLCAIIIHAVSDLMASYKSTWKLYLIQPLDCGIFLVGVFIAVFSSIEYGIYWAMCSSAALIMWRMCWTNGTFLGRVKIVEVINPLIVKNNSQSDNSNSNPNSNDKTFLNSGLLSMADSYISTNSCVKYREASECVESIHSFDSNNLNNNLFVSNYRWVPLPNENLNSSSIHTRFINPNVLIEKPPNGLVVYRMSESFVYPNASAQTDKIVDYIKREFEPSNVKRELLWNSIADYKTLNWNWKIKPNFNLKKINLFNKKKIHNDEEQGSDIEFDRNYQTDSQNILTSDQSNNDSKLTKPKFKLLHLDFSQVTAVDATSIQALIDMKRTIELFTVSPFEIHFSGIINPWVIHSLVNAGFAKNPKKHLSSSEDEGEDLDDYKLHETETQHQNNNEIEVDIEEDRFNESENERLPSNSSEEEEKFSDYITTAMSSDGLLYPVFGTNLPNFHLDIPSYSDL